MRSSSGGPRIIKPMMTDEKAEIRTAAAPTSFPTFARGCIWGLARSTTASKAVLTNSAVQTPPMVKIRIAHWVSGKLSQAARNTTIAEARA
jgi:hypothetical protein